MAITPPRRRLQADFALKSTCGIYAVHRVVYEVDHESWMLSKLLRRFIWHDRIHRKAITKILSKQVQLGLIGQYEDAFRFGAEV